MLTTEYHYANHHHHASRPITSHQRQCINASLHHNTAANTLNKIECVTHFTDLKMLVDSMDPHFVPELTSPRP